RIGIGELEDRVRLEPLTDQEAVLLLRAVARLHGLDRLVNKDNSVLANYCRRMNNNPGFIKWFVSAVQAGMRPEEALERPEVFLDFCMSNVYNFLNPEAKHVLNVLLCLPGAKTQAE